MHVRALFELGDMLKLTRTCSEQELAIKTARQTIQVAIAELYRRSAVGCICRQGAGRSRIGSARLSLASLPSHLWPPEMLPAPFGVCSCFCARVRCGASDCVCAYVCVVLVNDQLCLQSALQGKALPHSSTLSFPYFLRLFPFRARLPSLPCRDKTQRYAACLHAFRSKRLQVSLVLLNVHALRQGMWRKLTLSHAATR
ncbi:hypothetical protein MPTK1_7g11960 [Marchantia polymorpha subsp. ruderalis]|uniref:Uncharacterized protein n=2 Tax=Marchantia polymorpha TaxID=3197 RepID=A0AAF6BYL5_MARPO|nr:hypothetical protein MARPO_0003s0209 [Marchantia polymorpha]BBN17099.1 hypothetical protein Mp_7g11960 [Marchantia polymorpha subsp. ruderalis]|eukprot:PTQ49336.1 hypothetical protein MARPO_0003s0209 [Marchantia polymorpha]